MTKNSLTCNACGATSHAEGSRFCPVCGKSLVIEAEDINTMDTPTAECLPLSEVQPIPHTPQPHAPPSHADSPSTLGITADDIGQTPSVHTALYFKNPTPEIMSRTKSFQLSFGVLFIGTPRQTGKFTVPKNISVVSVLDGTKIDLSIADFVHKVTTIRVFPSVLSGVKIIVPGGVRVETQGLGILGGIKGISQNIPVSHDGPKIVVQGITVLGGIKVTVNHD
eukprot:CAMPEP_0113610108 /NCGR_PEP_ID=MMETSP0017_2-20120614/4850_1 /TAXON_ID=2856 /ORGANISM="Cylindrotheca closterium" /LENGTH=222 /DNA_ID=CAMNT_0000518973 /DNA_START=113 /DNA_END=778 /DNA_ORIENTATION=+ /assembly_acc=CAM_ASM_000147